METCSIGYFTADALETKWGQLAIIRDRAGDFFSCELYPDKQVFAESSANYSCFELPAISLIKSRQYAELPDGSYVSPIKDNEVSASSQMTATLINTSIDQPDWQFAEKQLSCYLRSRQIALVNGTKLTIDIKTDRVINLTILLENSLKQPRFFKVTPTTRINFIHNSTNSQSNIVEYPSFTEISKKLMKYINFSIFNSKEAPKTLQGFQGFASFSASSSQNAKIKKQNHHPKGVLIVGSEGSGRSTLIKYVAEKLNLKIKEIDADKFSSTDLTYPDFSMKPAPKTVIILRNFDSSLLSDETSSFHKRVVSQLSNFIDRSNEVFFALTSISKDIISPSLQTAKRLSFTLIVPPLSSSDIKSILPSTFSQHAIDSSSGLSTRDLISARISGQESDLFDLMSNVNANDGSQIRSSVSQTHWEDIGGLSETKRAVREAVEWPLTRSKDLKEFGIKPPRGVLLFGPPGCGKTMIARAIATSLCSSFFSISAASVFQMYLGESERIVRELFALARQKVPAVVFIDEIDAMVGKRGKTTTGVSERVLSTFLNEMDGITGLDDVVVVAATNRKDALDEALCRPGRFDCLIEVEPCRNEEDIKEILEVCTRKMPLVDERDDSDDRKGNNTTIEGVRKLIKIGTSGAEIDNFCREAALLALNRGLDKIDLDCFAAVIENTQNR